MIYYNLDSCNILTDEGLLHLSDQLIGDVEQIEKEKEIKNSSKNNQLQTWYNSSRYLLLFSTGYLIFSVSSLVAYKVYQYFGSF